MKKYDKIAIIVAAAVIIIVIILMIFVVSGLEYELKKVEAGEEALGFTYGSPYVNGIEVFMITEVVPDGPMDKAGAEAEDIILDKGIDQFFHELYKHRGQYYTFMVERNGTDKSITVEVPYYDID